MDSWRFSANIVVFERLNVLVEFRCDEKQSSIFYRHSFEVTDDPRCKCDPAFRHIFCVRLIGLIPTFLLLRCYSRPFLLISQSDVAQISLDLLSLPRLVPNLNQLRIHILYNVLQQSLRASPSDRRSKMVQNREFVGSPLRILYI